MRTNGRSLPQRTDRGASLVEFALIVPLLSMFLFGIVQFGIAYDNQQSINASAREGARTAAIPTNDVAAVKTAASSAFQGLDADGALTIAVYLNDDIPANEVVSGYPCDGHKGETVIVTAAIDHVLTIPFWGAPTLTLKGRGEFRCERAA